MSLTCSPNFQFTFSWFDKVTYVTGSYRLTPQRSVANIFKKTRLLILYKIGYVYKIP